MSEIKKSDWVTVSGGSKLGHKGFVVRVAKDGSWADVRWRLMGDEYTKRMKTTSLQPLHTIDIGDGMTVTDVTRKHEIEVQQ